MVTRQSVKVILNFPGKTDGEITGKFFDRRGVIILAAEEVYYRMI